MPQSDEDHAVRDATLTFVLGLAPEFVRLEARVTSHEGMALLCSVETALSQALPRPAAQELVWLRDLPPAGLSVLRSARVRGRSGVTGRGGA